MIHLDKKTVHILSAIRSAIITLQDAKREVENNSCMNLHEVMRDITGAINGIKREI